MSSTATACGKLILFGEHAVVHGHPGIAVPVKDRSVTVTIGANKDATSFLSTDQPLTEAERILLELSISSVCESLHLLREDFSVNISSSIPLGAGMGSSAAITIALIRALSAHENISLDEKATSNMAFTAEKVFHGTPSGIDNTTIAYEQSVVFSKGNLEVLQLGAPLTLIVADTGIRSDTKTAVGAVRSRLEKDGEGTNKILQDIHALTSSAVQSLRTGNAVEIGSLMSKNHEKLVKLGVSCDALDELALASLNAGALGAKLTGSGKGGHLIALVSEATKDAVFEALDSHPKCAGVFTTVIR